MEVSSNKLMDLVLALGVQILKLVQVSLDIQTIGGQDVRFPLDEMLTLNSCYLAKTETCQFEIFHTVYLTVVKTCARWALALSMQYL